MAEQVRSGLICFVPKELMKNSNSGEKDLETIAVLAAAFLVFYAVFKNNGFLLAAFLLLFTGLFFKSAASKISTLWLKFAELLGAFNTRLLLGLVYFLVLTPIAVAFRLLTRKHANSPRPASDKSYFTVREHTFAAADLEKMW